MKYVVPGLTPYTEYRFRVKAVNYVGSSPWSAYSEKVQTKQAGKSLISILKQNDGDNVTCASHQIILCFYSLAPSYKLKQVNGVAVTKNTIEVTWEVRYLISFESTEQSTLA